jgi:hypothetical protein
VKAKRKTFVELYSDLAWVAPALAVELIDNTRQCGRMTHMIGNWLFERGHFVDTVEGSGQYGSHFDIMVDTSDRGWVSVDPTAIQFHAPPNMQAAYHLAERELATDDEAVLEARALQLFEPTLQWLARGLHGDPGVFEIGAFPKRRRIPHPRPATAMDLDSKEPGVVWKVATPRDSQYRDATWGEFWTRTRNRALNYLATGDLSALYGYGRRRVPPEGLRLKRLVERDP